MRKFIIGAALALLAVVPALLIAKTGIKIYDLEGNVTNIAAETIDHIEFYESDADPLEEAMSNMDGIVKLDKEMLGETEVWDEGFVSSEGFILTTGIGNEFAKMKRYAEALEDAEGDEPAEGDKVEETPPCIGVMSTDKTTLFYLFLDEYGDPTQLICGNNILYFNFLNDEVLELTLSVNGSELEYVTAIHVDRAALNEALSNQDFSFLFQARLATVVFLLENADVPAPFDLAVQFFTAICKLQMASDQGATLEDLIENGLLGETGLAEAVEDLTEQFIEAVTDVKYSIVIWTGKATFKVGGTSCTLSGTIHCASDAIDEYGVYGIVCDTDPEKLTIEEAEYVGTAIQQDNNFDVDFRGLQALTKYYYRAYYKFNSEDHGPLMFKYGEPDAQIAYDTVTKDFETGENRLEVDVVMCIDVTGSMSDIIRTVKNNAMSFYDSFNEKCIDNGIELDGLNNKVIAFQDINVDGSRWWKESDFYSLPDQKEDFDGFVSSLAADGGGDTPESGLEALMGAFKALEDAVDDGYHRQVVILWTDAPFLTGSYYTELDVQTVLDKWDSLSSGRRLILFAPNGTYGCSNGGDWSVFDGHKNIIHSTSITASFRDFDYILDSIIEELIGKGGEYSAPARKQKSGVDYIEIVPRANN